MADELSDFFAPPPFKIDEALVSLRSKVRDIKPLTEKVSGAVVTFSLRQMPVVEMSLTPGVSASGQPAMVLKQAKRPSPRPEWQTHTLASSAEVRKWLDQLQLSVKRWDDED
ncbi:MAG: hypothetical protein ACOYNB_01750 [Aquabacterium sp.]|uniref:hypothetical protein n=1 Tax=Aquabacterium sp. TaxID=1872578 RepID=UPI003BBDC6D8